MLADGDVHCVLIGGLAAAAHGSIRTTRVYGVRCLCVDLPTLIATKRAAGRPKDLEAIAELEALREEIGGDRN